MVEVRAGVSEGGRNLVRFDPEFCGSCPFNGMKVSSGASGRS